jgi:AcrR family transcriptional regulator
MPNKKTLAELKEAEKQARRDIILEAAITLFSTHKISNVGIRDIAKEAGISPALIYRYFDDRDSLFLAVFHKKSEEMIVSITESLEKNSHTTPETVGKEFVTYLLDNELFFQMMTYFMLDRDYSEKVVNKLNQMIREIMKVFDRSFQDTAIANKENIRMYSHALFAALNGIMITFYNYPGRSEEEVRNYVLSLASVIGTQFNTVKPLGE